MSTLLIKYAYIVTMDDHQREIPDGGLFVRDGFIEQVGPTAELPAEADEILDLSGHVLLPGLVNTHHHFYQTLTRVVPPAQDANLFNWLKTLYPIWARLTPEDIFISTQTALTELALSGCTTASDHLYLFPNGSKLDDEIAAAKETGLRLQASRGSMSLSEKDGGLPPDSVVDTEEAILKDSQRLIESYHDANPGAFTQIVLAPCSPFSVTSDLMRESAKLAREYGVHLHTHLAETEDEEQFCLDMFGHRPVGYMQEVDWVGEDVWFAHAIWVNDEEIDVFAEAQMRRGALSQLEYAPGFRNRAHQGISEGRRECRHRCRRLCLQRWLVPAGRSPPGVFALACQGRHHRFFPHPIPRSGGIPSPSGRGARGEGSNVRPRSALSRHAWRSGGARSQRHRLARTWQMRRLLCHRSQSHRIFGRRRA